MMVNYKRRIHYFQLLVCIVVCIGCTAKGDDTGLEFAPQMYHSTPYEPLTQIKDKSAGNIIDSNDEDEHGEFYNSNPYNPHQMNVLKPVAGTVRRGQFLPYNLNAEDVDSAQNIKNPLTINEEMVKEGKLLYERFCTHCHGEKGQGDGLVGQVYLGVPAYNAGATKELSEGHIFHVITHGIRRMGAHGSQLNQKERWKIVAYVQKLQNL